MNFQIEHLLKNVLGYKKGERIALLHDHTFIKACSSLSTDLLDRRISHDVYEYGFMPEAVMPNHIREIFLGKKYQIIVLGFYHNIWHTPERKVAKYEKGKRLANLVHPDEPCEFFMTDPAEFKYIGKKIFDIFNSGKNLEIYTEEGTDLTAKIGTAFLESGDYTDPGSGGDFPSGEVGCSPEFETVNGRIVFDSKIQHVGTVTQDPHIVDVLNDKIEIVHGSEMYRQLLSSHEVLNYVAEISMGLNSRYVFAPNRQSIAEEKNLGTMHFGCGGNASYGCREGPHFDSVILKPTLLIDGNVILNSGKLAQNI